MDVEVLVQQLNGDVMIVGEKSFIRTAPFSMLTVNPTASTRVQVESMTACPAVPRHEPLQRLSDGVRREGEPLAYLYGRGLMIESDYDEVHLDYLPSKLRRNSKSGQAAQKVPDARRQGAPNEAHFVVRRSEKRRRQRRRWDFFSGLTGRAPRQAQGL